LGDRAEDDQQHFCSMLQFLQILDQMRARPGGSLKGVLKGPEEK